MGLVVANVFQRRWWLEKITDALKVAGEVEGAQCLFLVDSGAAVSLLPRSLCQARSLHSKLERGQDSLKLTSVDGSTLDVLGHTVVLVKIGFWVVKHRFV